MFKQKRIAHHAFSWRAHGWQGYQIGTRFQKDTFTERGIFKFISVSLMLHHRGFVVSETLLAGS